MSLPSSEPEATISSRYPGRETQITQLETLLSLTRDSLKPHLPSPQNLILYGLPSTGKSSILNAVLSSCSSPHTVVKCRECVTTRHLLESTTQAILSALQSSTPLDEAASGTERRKYVRTENVNALAAHLQRLLLDTSEDASQGNKLLLCFDDIDELREASPNLLPALARLSLTVPNLTTIFTLKTPFPRLFHLPGIPHVHFPAYTRSQAIHILSLQPPPLKLPPSSSSGQDQKETAAREQLFPRFAAAVYDSLSKHAGRDIPSFRDTCLHLWPDFVRPVEDGTFSAKEFSRLMVNKRALFQGEEGLLGGFEIEYGNIDPEREDDAMELSFPGGRVGGLDSIDGWAVREKEGGDTGIAALPTTAKYILIAAYLASHNPARTDPVFFAEYSEKKKRRRRDKRGKLGDGKSQKIPQQLLPPSSFPLSRLLAIMQALLPNPLPAGSPHASDILTAVASLTSLGLLSLAAGSGGRSADSLDPGAKWKANIGWETARELGPSVGVVVEDYACE